MVAEEEKASQPYTQSSDEEDLKEVGAAYYTVPLQIGKRENVPLSSLLGKLTEELQRQLGADLWLLMLYGSYARGEAQPDSDVDLFVVLRRASEAAYEKVRQIAYRVMWEADFAYVFSLYLTDARHYRTLEQHSSSFLRNIQREGQVLWKAT